MIKGYEKKPDACIFCDISKNSSDYMLYSDEHCFIVMNKFPYTSGHFLLIPHRHISSVVDLSPESWAHISALIPKASALLSHTLKTTHLNIGMNINEHSGANIPEHLHIHFVPRYKGDTNFMSAINGVRVYPNDFDEIYQLLKSRVAEFLN